MRRAFTLVELLVVVAIIAILIAILLPAIQKVRESSRRSQCANNLKQMGVGAHNHANAHGFFPSGGWGWWWIGDPDYGVGRAQPGGWVFSLLPYVEQQTVWKMMAGKSAAEKRTAGAQMVATPIAMFTCPTRRGGGGNQAYPANKSSGAYANIDKPALVARTDYAGNGGTIVDDSQPSGAPMTYSAAAGFAWRTNYNGIVFPRSEIYPGKILDGDGNTYLYGERFMDIDSYISGQHSADDDCMYIGYDRDINRWATDQPRGDCRAKDSSGNMPGWTSLAFGSAHDKVFNVTMCDGSVHGIPFEVDLNIHKALAVRNDRKYVKFDDIWK